jgi:hypothetical protein
MIFGKFRIDWRGEGGAILERRRREIFSQNLERERGENYEDFHPKNTYIPLCVQIPESPSS